MKYLDQYKELHKKKRYGVSGDRCAEELEKRITKDMKSLLDYGAGQSNTADIIRANRGLEKENIRQYDPAVSGRDSDITRSYDVTICTDVLEHVPEEELDEVLIDIQSNTMKEVWFVIALKPACEILPCGDNAHCTVHPADWWENRLRQVFQVVQYQPRPSHTHRTAWFRCLV